MKMKLVEALISISNASQETSKLADQVISDNSSELVQQLYRRIKDLEHKIAMLTTMSDEEDDLTDADKIVIAQTFSARLAEQGWGAVTSVGSFSSLKQYTKPVRLIIAQALRDFAVKSEKVPSDLWLDIIALDGDIK